MQAFGGTNFQTAVSCTSIQYLDTKLCSGKHQEVQCLKICFLHAYTSHSFSLRAMFRCLPSTFPFVLGQVTEKVFKTTNFPRKYAHLWN